MDIPNAFVLIKGGNGCHIHVPFKKKKSVLPDIDFL